MQVETVQSVQASPDRLWSLTWLPNGSGVLTLGEDRVARIWPYNAAERRFGAQCTTLPTADAHQRSLRCAAYHPQRHDVLAICGFDGRTILWQARGPRWRQLATLEGHENEVKAVAWATMLPSRPDAPWLLATCGRDRSVWLWAVDVAEEDADCVAVLQEHDADVKSLAWHPARPLLASAAADDTIRLWRPESDAPDPADADWGLAQTLTGHGSCIWRLAFSGDGHSLYSCDEDGQVRLWTETPDGTYIDTALSASVSPRALYDAALSPDGRLLALATGEDAIALLDAATLQARATLHHAHLGDVNALAWGPSVDVLASVGDDGTLRLHRVVNE